MVGIPSGLSFWGCLGLFSGVMLVLGSVTCFPLQRGPVLFTLTSILGEGNLEDVDFLSCMTSIQFNHDKGSNQFLPEDLPKTKSTSYKLLINEILHQLES